MENVPTAHNEANINDIAKTVIMPGDPLRAEYIANKYLKKVKCYNKVRSMYGFTGYYNDVRLSIQGSGMGCPSMGIYSKELFDFYGVDNIIRVGSAGALDNNLKLKDIVLASKDYTNSNYISLVKNDYKIGESYIESSKILLDMAENIANQNNISYVSGNVYTSDVFYASMDTQKKLASNGMLAVEMETAALYTNAFNSKKNALAILSISDNPLTGESLSSTDRQVSFNQMIELALDVAIRCSRSEN